MPLIKAQEAAIFDIPDVRFAALAAPSRGSRENAVWRVTLAPGAKGAAHSLSREEVLVVLTGHATAQIGDQTHSAAPGDALIVPVGVQFTLSNPSAQPFEAIAVLPVGGQAQIGQQAPFTPPWAV